MNHQIQAILWKNFLMTKTSELMKEAFIPLLSVAILFIGNYNKELGSLFVELMLPIYIPSSFIGLSRQMLVDYVSEKTNKLRDIYRIMGMKLRNYRIAWFMTYYSKSFIIYLILSPAIIISQSLGFLDIIEINLSFLLFLATCITQSLALSSLFSNAQLAGEFGSFFLTITSLIYFMIYFSRNAFTYLIICLFPQSAFSLILMSFISKQATFIKEDIDIITINCSFILNIFLYVMIYIYFENVLDIYNPKEWNYIFKRKNVEQTQDIEMRPYHQQEDHEELLEFCSISMINVNKHYQNTHALKDLSLQIYSQQILCILGQNGAGKTTTLNILTGLTNKSSGTINVMGQEINQDISNIVGYCTQENLLYGELTTMQNLEYQGKLRGLSGFLLRQECNKILELLSLQQYEYVLTSQLSGGNRRKVQLGVALMANSQIIFLDEPTASLDPVSRRQLWDILIELKRHNKTLILTTHFMDEAEFLANKIAILKKGQLVIYGTSQQIKKQLQVGYTLQVYNNNKNNNNGNILLHDSKVIKQTNDYQVLQLLQTNIFCYCKGIEQLEQQNYKIKLVQNTLEDAYLKLNKEKIEQQQLSIQSGIFTMQFTESKKLKFIYQLYGLLIKKYYCTIRSFSIMIMIVLPLVFLLAGVVIGHHYLDELNNNLIELKLFFVSLFIVQSFSLNSSIFINTPLQERELRIRQQLKLMKCSQIAYYLATFLGDYCILIFSTLCIYLMLCTDYMLFYQPYRNECVLVLLLFGAAEISFSYVFSFLFTSTKSAYKIFPVLNFLAFYSLPQVLTDVILKDPNYSIGISYLSPFFALDRTLKYLPKNEHHPYINAMIVQIIIYVFLYFVLEKRLILYSNNQYNFNEGIILNQLSHQYEDSSKLQLQQVNLKLQKQQILGILGPNGAGKSTMIQLITDCIKIQKGNISYDNQITMAVCQQAEGLWEELKAEEIAYVYALIKGAEGRIQAEINNILGELQLQQLGQINQLSGGQRRKIALAITLLGRDNLLVLDEPSNGLDPVSRRNLQNLIREHVNQHQSSIILTTHDMEEAQNLSDEIAILINGKVVVNNTSEELINKYGTGVKLVIQTNQNIEILSELKYCRFEKEETNIILYMDKTMQVSQTLKELQNLQLQGLIDDFNFSEANLEQVFIHLTRQQFDE